MEFHTEEETKENERSPSVALLCACLLRRGMVYELERVMRVQPIMRRSHCGCCLCRLSGCFADRNAEYWLVIGHSLLSTVRIYLHDRFASRFAECWL